MRKLMALAALALLAGAGCGDDGGDADGDDGTNGTDAGEAAADTPVDGDDAVSKTVPACQEEAIAADVVADVFSGTDATVMQQGDSCTYEVSGGLVEAVALVDPQPASETWLSYRNMMEQGGEELVEVEGVGDEAYTFTPVPNEPQLVVRTGLTMFSVGFRGDVTPEAMDALEAFAQEVVDYLGTVDLESHEASDVPEGGDAEG